MQIINQIGHIQHWGLSPATNILHFFQKQQKQGQPIRILLSGGQDIRHIMKTLCDIHLQQNETKIKQQKYKKIEFYIHEPNKQILARILLFLHIIHETSLNFEERIQLFLDLYGNAMIKERNARYVNNFKEDLLNFIHGEKQIITPLQKFVNLKLLKFEERDEMSEFIQSWSTKTPFDMQKYRDQKIRYLYKERYDYRANLIDWDYNMLLIGCAPIMHYYHYKQWRMSGLAFEQRFSTYTQPNRTLSSYAEGKKKQQRTSCLVRGYWGDIIISPYIAMGVKCDYKQKELLFKKANEKYIGHTVELTQYNLNYWLKMIETGEQYKKIFRDYYRTDEQTKKKLDEKDEEKKKKKKELKQIKQEGEDQKEEENEETKQQKTEENTQQQIKQQPQKKPAKKEEELDSDEEQLKKKVDNINAKEIQYKKEDKQVLHAFKKYGVSIYLMGMDSEHLIKQKYKEMFDIGVIGFVHAAFLNKNVQSLIKKDGTLMVEKATYIVPKKKEERIEMNKKLNQLAAIDSSLKIIEESDEFFIYHKSK